MSKLPITAAVLIGLCLGIAPAVAQSQSAGQPIDISGAGTTPEEHQAFMQAMPPEQQAGVIEACVPVIVAASPNEQPAVAAFCKTVASSGVPAAGKTAEENTAFVAGLAPEQQANIKAVCVPFIAKPENSEEAVLLTFCKNVSGT